jgi:regulator of protease activity HflC (stomatin/prohibitin superfamily)
LGKDGFVIDQLTINGALRLPGNFADSINQAMEATQRAIQAENRVRQVRAEADQAIAQAKGSAEASRERARGEADALLIRARAEARANMIIQMSATGSVLQYRALERWDGKLPAMTSGQLPMLTFDVSKGGLSADSMKRLREMLDEPTQNATEVAPTTSAAPPAPEVPSSAPAAPGPANSK